MFVDGEVKVRRSNNAVASGRKTLVWMESVESGNTYNILPDYQHEMEAFLNGRTINQGTDNLFGNKDDGSGNNNNIERVDWVVGSGLRSANVVQSGFAILERGNDNEHDPFCIAAILEIDAAGNPTSYGKIVRVAESHYGNLPSSTVSYSILRKEEGEARLFRSTQGTQKRGGVFISLQSLGLKAGQAFYGYSLFANDLPVSATPANLVNYTDPKFFPRTTSASTGEGGIDLIAITGLFNSSTVAITLPVKLKSFKAERQARGVLLEWNLTQAESLERIEIEKSSDGQQFQKLAEVKAGERAYTDGEADGNKLFYRLRLVEKDGTAIYSAIKTVGSSDAVAINLAAHFSGSEVRLSFWDKAPKPLTLTLVDMQGRVLCKKEIASKAGTNNASLPCQPFKGAAVLVLTGNRLKAQCYLFN